MIVILELDFTTLTDEELSDVERNLKEECERRRIASIKLTDKEHAIYAQVSRRETVRAVETRLGCSFGDAWKVVHYHYPHNQNYKDERRDAFLSRARSKKLKNILTASV